MARKFIVELNKRNSALSALGWYCAGLFSLMVLFVFVDQRVVQGGGTWVKPAKILFSLTVYVWTLAWFSKYVAKPRWRIRTLSVFVVLATVVESICLAVQAARGTQAYFNSSTDFDAMINVLMTSMIAVNFLMVLFFLAILRKPGTDIHPTYLWGIRFGFMVFVFGGWIGKEMMFSSGPAVSDLALAHALGLHGLQILPILGYGISIWREVPNNIGKLCLISAAALGYFYMVFAFYRQATLAQAFTAV